MSAAWNKFDYEITGFRHLTSLTTLNVSVTSFNRISLECATRDLPMLDTLDISNTKVKRITQAFINAFMVAGLVGHYRFVEFWSQKA